MARKLPLFDMMWKEYPADSPDLVKAQIGGNVNATWITNTCVIRMSRTLNYAKHPIPRDFVGLSTVRGGDGLRYAFRVKEFSPYMQAKYGKPSLKASALTGAAEPPATFVGKKGVIMFDVRGWSDATGHFDLWDGEKCAGHAYFEKAHEVLLWEAPASPP